MFTRNHPTNKPENTSIFRILMHAGAEIQLIADYCTTSEPEFGNGYAFWSCPEDTADPPTCLAIFSRDSLDAIIIHA